MTDQEITWNQDELLGRLLIEGQASGDVGTQIACVLIAELDFGRRELAARSAHPGGETLVEETILAVERIDDAWSKVGPAYAALEGVLRSRREPLKKLATTKFANRAVRDAAFAKLVDSDGLDQARARLSDALRALAAAYNSSLRDQGRITECPICDSRRAAEREL